MATVFVQPAAQHLRWGLRQRFEREGPEEAALAARRDDRDPSSSRAKRSLFGRELVGGDAERGAQRRDSLDLLKDLGSQRCLGWEEPAPANMIRRLSRSSLPRLYICPLSCLGRVVCPSVGPLLQDSDTLVVTATKSFFKSVTAKNAVQPLNWDRI